MGALSRCHTRPACRQATAFHLCTFGDIAPNRYSSIRANEGPEPKLDPPVECLSVLPLFPMYLVAAMP